MLDAALVSADKPLVTIKQIAKYLDVSDETVRVLIKEGLPHWKLGKTIYAHPANISAWFISKTKQQIKDELPAEIE